MLNCWFSAAVKIDIQNGAEVNFVNTTIKGTVALHGSSTLISDGTTTIAKIQHGDATTTMSGKIVLGRNTTAVFDPAQIDTIDWRVEDYRYVDVPVRADCGADIATGRLRFQFVDPKHVHIFNATPINISVTPEHQVPAASVLFDIPPQFVPMYASACLLYRITNISDAGASNALKIGGAAEKATTMRVITAITVTTNSYYSIDFIYPLNDRLSS
jgi:hypothetical protein